MNLNFCYDLKTYFNAGVQFRWGITESSLGIVCGIWRNDAITCLSFLDNKNELRETLKKYRLSQDNPSRNLRVRSLIKTLLQKKHFNEHSDEIKLTLLATSFQKKVWDELARIPYGSVRTYKQIAESIGCPDAARAVGGACGQNPLAILIPCHRVISENHPQRIGYRWGTWRKLCLLEMESESTIHNRVF